MFEIYNVHVLFVCYFTFATWQLLITYMACLSVSNSTKRWHCRPVLLSILSQIYVGKGWCYLCCLLQSDTTQIWAAGIISCPPDSALLSLVTVWRFMLGCSLLEWISLHKSAGASKGKPPGPLFAQSLARRDQIPQSGKPSPPVAPICVLYDPIALWGLL